MAKDYQRIIQESMKDLARLTVSEEDRVYRKRALLFLLLKSGMCQTAKAAAQVVGYSEEYARKLVRTYEEDGSASVLRASVSRTSRKPYATNDDIDAVRQEMEAGRLTTWEDVRRYLRQARGVTYDDVSGVRKRLKKEGITLKNGQKRDR